MSRWYEWLYRFGITPWEEDAKQGKTAEQVSRLLDRIESESQPDFGQALDVGCGTGVWSVALASRGWQVTGVDIVPKAIRKARERAASAGVEATFIEADATALQASGVQTGYELIVDFECFNHLNDTQRLAVGREVSAIAAPNATVLILAWRRGKRGPMPPGATREDIETAFADWEVINEEPYQATANLPWLLRNIEPRYYCLARRS